MGNKMVEGMSAMNASASIIRCLRLYLSAQTPPHREITTCGSMEQMVDSNTSPIMALFLIAD